MIIIKGKDKKEVTKGAYEQFYKPLGYKPYVFIEAVYTEEPKVEETKVEEPKVENTRVEEPKVVNDKDTDDKIKRVTGHKSSNKIKKGE